MRTDIDSDCFCFAKAPFFFDNPFTFYTTLGRTGGFIEPKRTKAKGASEKAGAFLTFRWQEP
ncbi:hypothetical protein CLOSTMETH_03765, partial [[Clostridium] methylpentosum DSM 5476]